MITKTKIWKSIRQQLKVVEVEKSRSKRLTELVMTRIKDIPQDENKDK